MYDVNWDMFNVKNKDKQNAFETMCRHLFMRKFSVNGYNFQSNYNQTGLETEPIKYKDKSYGFQCKYSTSNNNAALYKEIYESLDKAYRIYPNALNNIYIYTNADIKENCTEEELTDAKKSSYRMRIARDAIKHNVKLEWIKKDNFAEILNETTNLDIYKLYFSSERELELMDDSISIEERTFLKSDAFLDLSLNDGIFSDKYWEIVNSRSSIILGDAGTGKTEILKKIYIICSEEFWDKYKKNYNSKGDIPVYVRLRECIMGDLEGLLRQRMHDYNINITDAKYNFIYIFDGLDEIANKYIDKVVLYISTLNERPNTRSILVSSRNDSSNLTFLYRKLTLNRYNINKINTELIDLYFEKSHDSKKLEIYKSRKRSIKKLLNEIDDIFSAKLLWQTVDTINSETTKIELIDKSINYLTTNYSKMNTLPIPEVKEKNIEDLNTEIAYFLHSNNKLNISLQEMQNIISTKYIKLTYLEVDEVISCLADMFFDVAQKEKKQYSYSFKHRRYQEYFLYKKIVDIFFDDPFILREQNLLTDKDFILNIFMKQSLKDNMRNKDVLKVLSLRFFETYLGREYWRDYRDSLIGLRSDYGVGDETYLDSKYLLEMLAVKSSEELFLLLKNEALSIKNFLSEKNFWKFVKVHYCFNNEDIRNKLIEEYSLTDAFIKRAGKENPYAFWWYKCEIDSVNPMDIYRKHIQRSQFNDINFDYFNSYKDDDPYGVVNFFKMSLEIRPDIVCELIDIICIEHLEVICYELLRDDKIYYLVTKEINITKLREKIISRIEKNPNENYKINTVVLFNILTKKSMNKELLEKRFKKVNVNHHGTWEHNIELNSHIVNILFDNNNNLYSHDCELGVEIRKIILNNYDENEEQILNLIIDTIQKYNLIYDNWFIYNNSKLIGSIIATFDFSHISLKIFLHKLLMYQSVISLSTVLYVVFMQNPKLFVVLTNAEILYKLYTESSQQLSYYDHNSDNDFMYSAMISVFDSSLSNKLIIKGLNNSIYRPGFRNEDLVSYILPYCLLIANQNHWFSMNELEEFSYKVFDMLQIMVDTTDSGSEQSYYKYFLEKCLPDSSILDKLYNISSNDIFSVNTSKDFSTDFNQINKENIKDYYLCKIKGVDYNNFDFWRQLISIGTTFENNLSSFFEILKKNHFPESYYESIGDYFSIITAVLVSNDNLKDLAIDFIIEQGGRSGLFNMIKAFSLTGNSEEAKRYIEQLFKLVEALVYPNKSQYITNQYEVTETSKALNIIYNSKKKDWYERERDRKLTYIKDPRIKITWNDSDTEFKEDWAIYHLDPNAYKVNYYISLDDTIIEEFPLVYVDGYKALLPMPKVGTNIIPRKKYNIALLLNDENNLRQYIRRSGLIVE